MQVQLGWLKQQPSESFSGFIVQFQEHAFQMGFNEEALIFHLQDSVLPGIDLTIASQPIPPVTYDQ